MSFPAERPRRLRTTAGLREMVRETDLLPRHLIWPLFVRAGQGVREPVPSMPGVFRYSPDTAAAACREAARLGLRGVLLFGLPETKDEHGDAALDPAGAVPEALRRIREAEPDLVLLTDVCLCAYTSHGHCGILRENSIDNDLTLEQLVRMSLLHARSGASGVAPSDMMDGRVGAIREALESEGLAETLILSYAVKYASAYYGPFRDAAGSAPGFGDRRSHQMDPANVREALREVRLDLEEGADLMMVKPALAYLDVVRAVRESADVPVVAYNVSGEYSMIKAAAANGWVDERAVALETLVSMRRAGADLIISYHAPEAARWLA